MKPSSLPKEENRGDTSKNRTRALWLQVVRATTAPPPLHHSVNSNNINGPETSITRKEQHRMWTGLRHLLNLCRILVTHSAPKNKTKENKQSGTRARLIVMNGTGAGRRQSLRGPSYTKRARVEQGEVMR